MFRKKVISAFLILTFTGQAFVFGQAAASAVYTAPREVIDKIRDEGMNRSQLMQTLS